MTDFQKPIKITISDPDTGEVLQERVIAKHHRPAHDRERAYVDGDGRLRPVVPQRRVGLALQAGKIRRHIFYLGRRADSLAAVTIKQGGEEVHAGPRLGRAASARRARATPARMLRGRLFPGIRRSSACTG